MRATACLAVVVLGGCAGYQPEPYLEVTFGELNSHQRTAGFVDSNGQLDGWSTMAGLRYRAPVVMSETDREISRRGAGMPATDTGADERVRALEDSLRVETARAAKLEAELGASVRAAEAARRDRAAALTTVGERDAEVARLNVELEKAKGLGQLLDVDWSNPGTLLALLIVVLGIVLVLRKTGLPVIGKREAKPE